MENVWIPIITGVLSLFAGGGIWGWIKAREEKRKTPYDMFRDLLLEQKKFYEERNADYEREKLDSAEKSSVIMQSHFCKHRFSNPDIICPVDVANDDRLKKRCDRVGYCPIQHEIENPNDDENDRFNSNPLHGDAGGARRPGVGH